MEMDACATECTICLNNISKEQIIFICPQSDKHIYHNECMKKWYSVTKTCPVCRCAVNMPLDVPNYLHHTRVKYLLQKYPNLVTDIDLIVGQTHASFAEAIYAYDLHDGDIVDAIMGLTDE